MRMEIRVIDGAALVRLRQLAKFMTPEERAKNNRKAGIQMHSLVMATFKAEGATEGREPWDDLKLHGRWRTRIDKQGHRKRAIFSDFKRGKGGVPVLDDDGNMIRAYQILQDTGALRQSYIPLSDSDYAGVGADSNAAHAEIAELHEFGDPYNNLPARPMLPTNESAVSAVYQIYQIAAEAAASNK